MDDLKINDSVLISVKRINVIAKIAKIENEIATCSFYMPRSKGMSMVKIPLNELTKVKGKTSSPEK